MKRLEKIFAVGGFVLGVSLIGFGLYRDDKFSENYQRDYIINTVIKSAGVLSFGIGTALTMRGMTEKDDMIIPPR